MQRHILKQLFLMHRVELKATQLGVKGRWVVYAFLMHRVELKGGRTTNIHHLPSSS